MSELKYSEDAEAVMNLFFQVDYMLYVEGPDDVCFWEIIFQKTSKISVQVQDVGGSNELKPYIQRIMNNELDAIVACDSDFSIFDLNHKIHPNIIRTYGYSIENTFVNDKTVQRVIKNLGRFSAKELSLYNYKDWFSDIYIKTTPLVLLDIYNYINKLGIAVIGDNAERFMKSKKSSELCDLKINNYIESLCRKIEGYDAAVFHTNLLEKYNISMGLWLRGHFLLSAIFKSVMSFMSKSDKKVSFSSDAFYTGLMTAFEMTFNNSHPEYEYYTDVVNRVQVR